MVEMRGVYGLKLSDFEPFNGIEKYYQRVLSNDIEQFRDNKNEFKSSVKLRGRLLTLYSATVFGLAFTGVWKGTEGLIKLISN